MLPQMLFHMKGALVVKTANIPMITVRGPPPGESHDWRSMIKESPGTWHSLYSDMDCSRFLVTCRFFRLHRSMTKSARVIVQFCVIIVCFQCSLFSNKRLYAIFNTPTQSNNHVDPLINSNNVYMIFIRHFLIKLNIIFVVNGMNDYNR